MLNKTKKNRKKINLNIDPRNKVYTSLLLILSAILGRTVFHFGDNIEIVTAVTLLSGSYLGIFWAIMIPLVSMAISDLMIGNTIIFIFTWSAYFLIGLISFFVLKRNKNNNNQIARATLTGMFSAVFFYLWTNFGVWALDGHEMYSNSLSGLIDSYIMGLPFLKANIIGNMIFVPLVFYIFRVCLLTQLKLSSKEKFSQL